MATKILVNFGSVNGLLPGGTKPLPEPMLTNDQWGSVALTWDQFHRKISRYQFVKWVWKIHLYNYSHISQGPMSKALFSYFFPGVCVRTQCAFQSVWSLPGHGVLSSTWPALGVHHRQRTSRVLWSHPWNPRRECSQSSTIVSDQLYSAILYSHVQVSANMTTLTLYVLNFSEGIKIYVYILCQSSTLTWDW